MMDVRDDYWMCGSSIRIHIGSEAAGDTCITHNSAASKSHNQQDYPTSVEHIAGVV